MSANENEESPLIGIIPLNDDDYDLQDFLEYDFSDPNELLGNIDVTGDHDGHEFPKIKVLNEVTNTRVDNYDKSTLQDSHYQQIK